MWAQTGCRVISVTGCWLSKVTACESRSDRLASSFKTLLWEFYCTSTGCLTQVIYLFNKSDCSTRFPAWNSKAKLRECQLHTNQFGDCLPALCNGNVIYYNSLSVILVLLKLICTLCCHRRVDSTLWWSLKLYRVAIIIMECIIFWVVSQTYSMTDVVVWIAL